jgi:peptidoglycan-associated lipoprotein
MSPIARFLAPAIVALLVAGCGTGGMRGGPGDEPAPVTGVGADGLVVEGAQPGEATGVTTVRGSEFGPKARAGTPLSQRVIYFDFDQATVRSEYIPVVQAHAEWLRDHESQVLSVEGHTDERGSREYNIALGERRAIAVRQLMQFEGVTGSQLRLLSYGEERPAVAGGGGEATWTRNRRVELVYQGEGR